MAKNKNGADALSLTSLYAGKGCSTKRWTTDHFSPSRARTHHDLECKERVQNIETGLEVLNSAESGEASVSTRLLTQLTPSKVEKFCTWFVDQMGSMVVPSSCYAGSPLNIELVVVDICRTLLSVEAIRRTGITDDPVECEGWAVLAGAQSQPTCTSRLVGTRCAFHGRKTDARRGTPPLEVSWLWCESLEKRKKKEMQTRRDINRFVLVRRPRFWYQFGSVSGTLCAGQDTVTDEPLCVFEPSKVHLDCASGSLAET